MTLKDGTKYQTAYPDNTEQSLVNQLRAENVSVDVKPKGGSGWLTALGGTELAFFIAGIVGLSTSAYVWVRARSVPLVEEQPA